MTSTVLAQKILAVGLSKSEFEKIKLLRDKNLERKFKAVSSLKKIIEGQVINKTCRLCLKPGNRRIYDGQHEFDFVTCIGNILGIQVAENDGRPEHLCSACEITLRNADLLKQTAEVTQWRLEQELDMVADVADTAPTEVTQFHGGYFMQRGAKVAREWTCSKCRRSFDNKEEFSVHEQLLTCGVKDKNFVCESCGLELKTMTRFKRHRLIHSGAPAHQCGQCEYRARSGHALAVHAAARPAACTACAATFRSASNLASHRRRHLPPGYHCQICRRSFRFKGGLQNHVASQHSNAKPHVCNSCGKAFSTRKMICRHERRVHNRPKMRSGILPVYLRQEETCTYGV